MLRIAAVIAAASVAVAVTACSPSQPAEQVAEPVPPPAPRLETPRMAVLSYLDHVSYAYRMVNSELAEPVMTPREAVRVDAYIERNRQQNLGIEQRIISFEERFFSQEETSAVVAAREEWEYRYFTISPLAYDSPLHSASYDTTYTVIYEAGAWLVDTVEAQALGEVP